MSPAAAMPWTAITAWELLVDRLGVRRGEGSGAGQSLLIVGAHDVIDHHGDIPTQLAQIGLPTVDLIASLNATERNCPTLAQVLSPQGAIAVIDDPDHLDPTLLKNKAASPHWEFMFTRSTFETPDVIEQHLLLTEVARLVDEGVLRSTMHQNLGEISAAHLTRAHELVESGSIIGQVVLAGWPS